MRAFPLLLFSLALLPACTTGRIAETGAASPTVSRSLLASSSPADGSTVPAPVNKLEFRFAKPARLHEITVTGVDGLKMPIMVTAVGEVTRYSVPLDGLGAGSYTVDWRASSTGFDDQGDIHFVVK